MFTYADFIIGLIEKHFNSPNRLYHEFSNNIVQYFPPKNPHNNYIYIWG
jgi:hypothetical protein